MQFSQLLNTHRIFKPLAKALIRLCVCAGLSEALLVAHTTLLEISCRGSIIFLYEIIKLKSMLSGLNLMYLTFTLTYASTLS